MSEKELSENEDREPEQPIRDYHKVVEEQSVNLVLEIYNTNFNKKY